MSAITAHFMTRAKGDGLNIILSVSNRNTTCADRAVQRNHPLLALPDDDEETCTVSAIGAMLIDQRYCCERWLFLPSY